MTGPGVDLDYDDLTLVISNLEKFIDEFERAGGYTDRLRDAVGRPHHDGTLSGRVDDFQSGWDGNREVIVENLTNIHDHLRDIVDGFSSTDVELSKDAPESAGAAAQPQQVV